MAETLGSLCDKLTIIKLKQFHTKDAYRMKSLGKQENQLIEEIDHYIADALAGKIPIEKLSFAANKVYDKEKFIIEKISGNLGEIMAELAKVNCDLWHEQEKVYEFDTFPETEKNNIIKRLALLNLERVNCIDEINNTLIKLCQG